MSENESSGRREIVRCNEGNGGAEETQCAEPMQLSPPATFLPSFSLFCRFPYPPSWIIPSLHVMPTGDVIPVKFPFLAGVRHGGSFFFFEIFFFADTVVAP